MLGQEDQPAAQPATSESTETLQRELQAAKTENERLRTLGANLEQVSRCATLEKELAQTRQHIAVLQATTPDTATQERLPTLQKERDEAIGEAIQRSATPTPTDRLNSY